MTDSKVDPREEFTGRLFMGSLQAFEILTIYIGGKLGLYGSLQAHGPATQKQLAERSGVAERYTQEWLEQQAAAGIIDVDDVTNAPEERTYTLPDAHAEALLDRTSPFSIEPLIRFAGVISMALPKLLDAYRTGDGVSWEEFGIEGIEAQGDFNRPWLPALGAEYLPSLPDIHARLSDASKSARVADVACGVGWAAISIAQAYPHVVVDGFDLDEYSIGSARKNASEAGVADRVTFEARDAADPTAKGRYDLVTIIEAVHDLSNPVGVLRAAKGMLVPGGSLIVADEKVGETFTAPADETDRFMYAVSLLCCLPCGLAEQPSAATGTVMRSDTFRGYAKEAGFESVEVLDGIEHPMLRFYRLDA